jgi:hypothetical protein
MRLNPLHEWAPHPNLFMSTEIASRYKPDNILFRDVEFTFQFFDDTGESIHIFPIIFQIPSHQIFRDRPDLIDLCSKWETEDVQKLTLNKIIELEELQEAEMEEDEEGKEDSDSQGTTLQGSDVSCICSPDNPPAEPPYDKVDKIAEWMKITDLADNADWGGEYQKDGHNNWWKYVPNQDWLLLP